MRVDRTTGRGERGAILPLVGLALVVLVGMAGLVLDLGQMFVSKTELQNAADACALAGARELNARPTTLTVLTRAENAAISVGIQHRMGFQRDAVVFATDRDVTFSNAFNGGYVTKGGAPADTQYVRCTTNRTGIVPWLMQVLGIGNQQVSATAVASIQPGNTACILPIAMCRKIDPDPVTGLPVVCDDNTITPEPLSKLCKGQWYLGRFGTGGGTTGNFNWIDFNPHAGGAQDIAEALCGPGFCGVQIGSTLHAETGMNQSVEKCWNSRFGLYRNGAGNPQPSTAKMDRTGYSYTAADWGPPARDVLADYRAKQDVGTPYDGSVDGIDVGNPYQPSSSTDHLTKNGGDRRLVYVPVVDCSGWGPAHTVPALGIACVLMLTPNKSPNQDIGLEYRGMAGTSDDQCGTYGLPSGPGGFGPQVPTLVQ